MSPKISIITPVYNAGGDLKRAYESVNRQTLKDLEWLLIDDGSTDGTYESLEQLSAKNSYIKIFSQAHGGAGAARNYGLKMATGEYIAFLDIDDEYYQNDALEKMYAAGKKQNADIIGSYRMTETFDGIEAEPLFREFDIDNVDGKWIDFKDYQEDFHFHSYLFKKDFLIRDKIEFPLYKRYQDPVFLLKALSITQKVLVVPVELYYYHYGNQNADLIERNITEILKGIKDNLIVAKNKNYQILFDKLIDRVNVFYYAEIMRNFSIEVIQLLFEINNLCKEFNGCEQVIQFTHVKDAAKGSYEIFLFEDLTKRYEAIIRPNNLIADYLLRNGLDKVAIYGMGAFGKRLLEDLKNSGVKVIAGIDKNTNRDDIDIEIFSPEQAKDLNCSAVIVSPIWYGDMAYRMEKCTQAKVIVLKHLIYFLEEQL